MYLKQYLKKELETKVVELKSELSKTKKILGVFNKIDINKADYHIHLFSLWAADGEKSPKFKYTGRLEDAIKEAEENFKKINNRGDVQAQYLVSIKLRGMEYAVPEEFWKKYAEKH
jgi:hypothetical protein